MRRLGNAGLACLGLFLASCAVKRAQVGLRTLLIVGILVAFKVLAVQCLADEHRRAPI